MQDIETYKKVQEKFENSLNKYAHILSKPYFKTFKDSLKAMLMSSTPIVRKIAQELPGRASVKKKQERITYHLDNKEAYNKLKDAYHMIESSKITNDSLIVIDESDITKPCSQKQENISKVRDGSTGEYKNGYYSFNATIVSQESIGSVSLSPLYSYIYSNKAEDESKNDRLSNFILDTTIYSNNKGIYVFDRGYDDRKLINQLCDQNNNFTMRSTGIRDLIVNNIKTSFKETVRNVKLKHEYFCSFKNRLFSYNAIKVNIITDPYPTKNPNTCEVWLVIARYGKRGGFFYFFANFNKGIESAKIIGQMVLEIYRKKVED